MHVSRNKCELLAEYLLAGAKAKYDINMEAKVKNIQLSEVSYLFYTHFQYGYLSHMIIKPKDELYWVWFDTLTECFYLIENGFYQNITDDAMLRLEFKNIIETANKNIEKEN